MTVINQIIERRTQKTCPDIVDRLREIKANDYFGFQSSDLLAYLPWDSAKEFLRPLSIEGEWRERYPVSIAPLRAALDYLPHAWKYANNCGTLSVLRAMEHFKSMYWLAGAGRTFLMCFEDYEFYGKPQLVMASEIVRFDWRGTDNGLWAMGPKNTFLSDAARGRAIDAALQMANEYMKE